MGGMYVFKPSPKHKTWTVGFTDHLGVSRRIQGFRNKRASEQLGRNLDELAQIIASGGEVPDHMAVWIRSNLDDKRREKLIAMGLITSRHLQAGVPLDTLVEQWAEHIRSEGRADKYATEQHARAQRILIDGCDFLTFKDIEPERLRAQVASIAKIRAWSRSTELHHLKSCKMFTGWMVRYGRALRDPLAVLRVGTLKPNEHSKKRRALTEQEAIWLIEWVRNHGPVRGWMPGPERSLLYQLVVFETGYRAGTVRSLKAGDFDLDSEIPIVTGKIKGGRLLTVPLTQGIVPDLRVHLSGKLAEAPAFRCPTVHWFADMLRLDMKDAGIDRINHKGRVDFHALRHTFITIASKTMDPKTLQEIAGHTDIRVTMRYYTHRLTSDLAQAKDVMGNCGVQCGVHAHPNGIKPKKAGA